jgi:hypothetical protein
MNISTKYVSQNDLLLSKLMMYYKHSNMLDNLLKIIAGETKISLRIIDWFATNYAKKYYTLYNVKGKRFKVYLDYKLKLKAYSKKRFDPFCRRDRITIPYKNGTSIETTIGQLNFFKWVFENNVIEYIEEHFEEIERDQTNRNSTSKRKDKDTNMTDNKTRKKREELSVSAIKSVKKEDVEIVVKFS